ncbi:MAG: archaellum operon transcriptional activator EarA family protein [Thermoproteota archaeon]
MEGSLFLFPRRDLETPRLAQIKSSLRKSRLRREVLTFLASIYPEASYSYEISRALGISATQVLGAIKGLPKSYEPKNSLLALELVEEVDWYAVGRIKLYRISKLGLRVANSLLKESYSKR